MNVVTSFQPKDYEALLFALDNTALVSITDHRGVITFVNDGFAEVSKYSKSELIGQNHRILKSGHQSEELFEVLWSTISTGKIWRGQIKNRAKDGTFYWVDTSITPLLAENGRPELYVAIRFVVDDTYHIQPK